MVAALCQSPGRIVADTKLDLTANPLGFLARAAHQWSSIAPLGQVQNQAYGYFFPHGAFFALGDLAHIPPWVTQRLWWGLLLAVGFWGVVRVAEALGIGSRTSRMVAAAAFVFAPRVLTTIGPISSETLPVMLAPWVLLPVIRALDGGDPGGTGDRGGLGAAGARPASMRMLAARSAAAVALMGAVNAVATGFACLIAGLWWAAHRPDARWRRFTAWWVPMLALACLWWLVPLWLLGQVSPPFLDFIESSSTTTRFASLPEVLRGTSSWTPFISPSTATGVPLVSEPILVLATGLLAAAGLAGLAMRRMPARGRLLLILLVGLAGMTIGYDGALGSAVADQVRAFLDGAGAPLRNVHKLEPLLRLPLVLGLAHLLGRVPLPGAVPWRRARSALAHPEHEPMTAVTALVAAALMLASSPAWLGDLAPPGGYSAIPDHWQQAADWLTDHADSTDATAAGMHRALVVPGAPFAIQEWGMTRDEPLQPLAETPWAVRDAIPLTPPGAIRALDAIQRQLADGRPSDTLAPTLRRMGIGYLVVRNDLDPELARAPRPLVVHAAIDGSPGLTRVAAFGEPPLPSTRQVPARTDPGGLDAGRGDGAVPADDEVTEFQDAGLRQDYPAIEIYRVGADPVTVAPYTVGLDEVPVVAGGPEVLARPRAFPAGTVPTGPAPTDAADTRPVPVVLYADARAAGLDPSAVAVTDTPTAREQDYGRVTGGTSGIRAATDPRRTPNAAPDYPVPGAGLVEGRWVGATVTASGSAADATQLGGVNPSSGTAAAFDGDPTTSWVSGGADSAVGQWLRLDLDAPIRSGTLTVRTDRMAVGPPVTGIEVQTARGTMGAAVPEPGAEVTVPIPPGTTRWIRIEAVRTADGTAGRQFGLSEVSLTTPDGPLDVHREVVLPPPPPRARVTQWSLGQEFPGRRQCAAAGGRVLCDTTLGGAAESPGVFTRTIDAPADTPLGAELTVRGRPGQDLDALLTPPGGVRAEADSDIVDPRGNAHAAVDGDPATSWYAADSAARHATSSPTITLRLPRESEVASLRVTPPAPAPGGRDGQSIPARPTTVTVDLGTGPQQRTVPADGIIALTPARTDTVTVSVTDWQEVPVDGAFGRRKDQAPGIAELAVFAGPHGTDRIGTVPDPDAPVTVGCGDGPVVTLNGHAIRTSVTATTRALRDGAPVTATVCGGATLQPAVGPDRLTVQPGGAFTVSTVTLTPQPTGGPTASGGAAASAPQPAHVATWGDDHRVMRVPASDEDRLLVVPESTNPGWVAEDASGTELQPIVVDGWQQGWIVPAGAATSVTLTFPSDHWYRLGLFGGLALLPLLFLAAAVPARRRERTAFGAATRTWSSTTAGAAGVLAAGFAVSGAAGVAVTAAGLAASAAGPLWARRIRAGGGRGGVAARCARVFATGRAWPVVAGAGLMLSVGVLATGPWLSGMPYQGHSPWAQVFALIGVAAAGVSAVPVSGRVRAGARRMVSRRASQRTRARRAGSSTKA
ncbi:alpha-(1-_3)-arabinofuranosyltransferase domain-containing protein [Tomitella gaofuii]|uniref:alpha-(1->3)-arabinofuranosyltransferase domain-containing protein n=1 Tax=Tomitella gaofuii TaxID=2760083 RepID=UPI0023EA8AD9